MSRRPSWLLVVIGLCGAACFGALAHAALADSLGAPLPPAVGTTIPPPVNATGQVGTSLEFARADHTHVSSILKVAIPTPDTTGALTWTFPPINGAPAFVAPPVVQVSVESTAGQPFVAQITARSASAISVQVFRAQALPQNLVTGLASGVFNVFGGTVPAGTTVHIYAAKATQ